MTLDEYIRRSGVSGKEWARTLGVSPSFLSRLRRGERGASLALALHIHRETGGKVQTESLLRKAAA